MVPVTVDGERVRLAVITYRPAGNGPFPTLVFHHGSTGRGTDPSLFARPYNPRPTVDWFVARGWAVCAWLCVAIIAAESLTAMPYPLAFFNRLAGGPGRGDRIVNDSNVDWGQGLIGLRDELRALHIVRVNLAYHGMVDPAVYGIDYIPYAGGPPDTTSDYLVVSSYFMAGLPARVMTSRGSSPQALQFDLGPLRAQEPLARPAGCLYLFRWR